MKKIKKLYQREKTDLSVQCVWHHPAYKTDEHMKKFEKEHKEAEDRLYKINGPGPDEIIRKVNEIIDVLNGLK